MVDHIDHVRFVEDGIGKAEDGGLLTWHECFHEEWKC